MFEHKDITEACNNLTYNTLLLGNVEYINYHLPYFENSWVSKLVNNELYKLFNTNLQEDKMCNAFQSELVEMI